MKIHLEPGFWHKLFTDIETYKIPLENARKALRLKESTFYRKLKQFHNGGVPPRKPGSGRKKKYIAKDYEPVIREILQKLPPSTGHHRVWIKLRFRGIILALGTVYRIMKELNLLAPRRPGHSPKSFVPVRPERPCEDWFSDTLGYWVGRWRVNIYGSIDAYSRFVPCLKVYFEKTAESTVMYYDKIFQFGLPQRLRSDNGGEFANRLAIAVLTSMGIEWRHGPKHTPQAQGIMERLFKTLKEEWLDWREFNTIEELQASLDEFVEWYNQQREHSALDYDYPEVVHNAVA